MRIKTSVFAYCATFDFEAFDHTGKPFHYQMSYPYAVDKDFKEELVSNEYLLGTVLEKCREQYKTIKDMSLWYKDVPTLNVSWSCERVETELDIKVTVM